MDRGTAQQQQTTSVSPQELTERSELAASGLRFQRVFTRDGTDPFDEIEWELRSAVIGNERGDPGYLGSIPVCLDLRTPQSPVLEQI